MKATAVGATVLTVAVAMLSIAAFVSAPAADLLEFRRAAIGDGQVWRLVTGQLIHVGPAHLAMNLAGLVVLALLGQRQGSRAFAPVPLLMLCIGTGGLLHAIAPDVGWYRGASGMLHGAALWVLADAWRGAETRLQRAASGVGATVLVGKVLLESLGIAAWDSSANIGARVVHEAHLAGTLAAACVLLLSWRWTVLRRVRVT